MSYEKMTAESFLEKLKAGGYKNIAGARRGVGKAALNKSAKESVQEQIDKYFAGSPTKTASKAPAKLVAKKTAKKSAKRASKSVKVSASPSTPPPSRRAPVTGDSLGDLAVAKAINSSSPTIEQTTRHYSASIVVQALSPHRGTFTANESVAYDAALEGYVNTLDMVQTSASIAAAPTPAPVPVPQPAPAPVPVTAAVAQPQPIPALPSLPSLPASITAPPGTRIPVPADAMPIPTKLPEPKNADEEEQFKRLRAAAVAVNAPNVPTQPSS